MTEDRIRTRMCDCGNGPLHGTSRICSKCSAETARVKANEYNALKREQLAQAKPQWKDTGNEEIDLTPWVPREKVQILSDAEQERINEEARQKETAAHQRYMEKFGMVIRKGKPLASTAKKLSPAEIAEIAHLYMPPCRGTGTVIVPYFGEGRE